MFSKSVGFRCRVFKKCWFQMSRLLLVEPDYYEEQKRLHENIARLEGERLLLEQSITAERAAINATAAQNASAWKGRLQQNIKTAKLKIEENREIMRRVDRLLFKIDAALDDCEYLESLKENMLNYAKEAYERWRSENPQRAARYWAERHSKENCYADEDKVSASVVERTREVPMTLEEENEEFREIPATSQRTFTKSPMQDTDKSIPSILKKKISVDDNSEGVLGQSNFKKSPRFSEHVEVAEFEKVTSREGLGDVPQEEVSTAKNENALITSLDSSPLEQLPAEKSYPRKEKTPKRDPNDMTPLEFFRASASYSGSKGGPKLFFGDPVMSSEDSIITSEENVSQKFSQDASSFVERRSHDEKNEFFGLDEDDMNSNLNLAPKNDYKIQLSMLGLQALFNRIESQMSMASPLSSEEMNVYSGTLNLTNIDEIIECANRNELNQSTAEVCAQTVLMALPFLLKNERLLNTETINFDQIQRLENFAALVEEANKDVFESLRQHLSSMLNQYPNLVGNLSKNFAKLFVGNSSSSLNAMQETLLIVLNKQHSNLDASQEEVSITHISMATPGSNRMSSPIAQIADSSEKNQSLASGDRKPSDLLERRSSLQTDKKEHYAAKAVDDDEDSFPFTSQSIDDHLNFSYQSDTAQKTSNAYQSLLLSAFGPTAKPDSETGSPGKGPSGQFEVSNFVDDESDDEIEGQLMQSATGSSKPTKSPEKQGSQKFYSMRTKEERTLSPKKSNCVANNESKDLFSSGDEETSLALSSARSKKDAIGITADVRSSLARKSGAVPNSLSLIGGNAVALRDFGDIDLGVSDDEGQNSTTDILGITPRDKHLADESSDDSDFFS